ncbi:hypothetical protein BCR33DRAFT_18828 [Rhizoclosmatium globosum]|uniref:Uncharacterized protein n=1 Tax=Rhizoclosmatium globosum TaxID=329046 RepID=A0A1Y2CQ85_9FUNG|nr:hypothetical protein BCR33DRAFT_18828 [Rhizoclosmatium globosum]|eukprot:ORY49117.1 hypothetical protein BCR33DRAFT_18828 [Rhizoclosmatium globosum]
MVGYRHEDSYMEQATNATGDHAIDVSVEQGDFGLNTLPFTTSRVSLTNVNVVPYHGTYCAFRLVTIKVSHSHFVDVVRYEHQYPVPVKVVKHLDPTDYEILDVDRNARGRDLKTEVCVQVLGLSASISALTIQKSFPTPSRSATCLSSMNRSMFSSFTIPKRKMESRGEC